MNSNNTDNKERHNLGSQQEENTDWFGITQRVRRYNRLLVGRVMELEKTIEEMKQKWELEKDTVQTDTNLIRLQNEELITSQEQIKDLLTKLELSNQVIQRQKLSLQDLSEKLKFSQEQGAKLERDCALLQSNYNKKNHQLVTLKAELQDLKSRLEQQENYALELEAVLDKNLKNTQDTITKAVDSPIKPWRGEPSDLGEEEPQENQTVTPPQPLITKEVKNAPFPEKIIPKNTEIRAKKTYSVELPSFLKSDNE